jgi:preprotein translocase subunit SecG
MGASFGSGASQTIFGSVGSGNALTKSTSWLATIFFITSLVLALFAKQQAGQGIQDSLLIENLNQSDTQVQEESDVPVSAAPATSDVPALPSTELQTGEAIPEVQQEVQQGAEPVAVDPEATQEPVEEPAEDLQNATQN